MTVGCEMMTRGGDVVAHRAEANRRRRACEASERGCVTTGERRGTARQGGVCRGSREGAIVGRVGGGCWE